jgi:hypothetical protein
MHCPGTLGCAQVCCCLSVSAAFSSLPVAFCPCRACPQCVCVPLLRCALGLSSSTSLGACWVPRARKPILMYFFSLAAPCLSFAPSPFWLLQHGRHTLARIIAAERASMGVPVRVDACRSAECLRARGWCTPHCPLRVARVINRCRSVCAYATECVCVLACFVEVRRAVVTVVPWCICMSPAELPSPLTPTLLRGSGLATFLVCAD